MAFVKTLCTLLIMLSPIIATEKICPGFGKLEMLGHEQVDESNINLFKNCTVIDGNIRIVTKTFKGSPYQGIQPIMPFQLENFRTVREITGYLYVSSSGNSQEDLSAFQNLETIGGNTLYSGSSLVVVKTNLQSLGLNSLRSIQNGNVFVRRNYELCYVKKELFEDTGIFQNEFGFPQRAVLLQNRPFSLCRSERRICHSDCRPALGCMGPTNDQCGSCKHYHLDDRCVDNCNTSGRYLISADTKECGLLNEEGVESPVEPQDELDLDNIDRNWHCSDENDQEACFSK
ncbi:epidermal growth factor receptor-like isoform X2 [Glandiceps talaboti]